MINEQSFFEIVDIKEEEKESARVFLSNRGITEHIRMAEYLSAFLNRKPTYQEVATAFRYDKRIRRIVYRYLGLFEEYLRAYLSDTYDTIQDIPNFSYKLIVRQNLLKETPLTGSTYDFTLKLYFSNLINVIKALPEEDKRKLFDGNIPLKKNLEALVQLRNAVSHNRTLINYKNLEEVTLLDGGISHSLESNINNLYMLLPAHTKEKYKACINAAIEERPNTLDSQVDWVICDFYILKL